jgi:hypothetical protein
MDTIKKPKRTLDYETLKEIASNYKKRIAFSKSDSGAYAKALQLGIIDDICSHMRPQKFSTPQSICKYIFDILFQRKCVFNSKRIITPYELDIYYPDLLFAVEYDGKYWHNREKSEHWLSEKKKKIQALGIRLLVISERSANYEKDIKNQIIENLTFINESTNNVFKSSDISDIVVDYKNVYDSLYDWEDIHKAIASVRDMTEFKEKFFKIHGVLTRTKQIHLIKHLKSRREVDARRNISDSDLIDEVLGKYNNFAVFKNEDVPTYRICKERKLLNKIKETMPTDATIYKYGNKKIPKIDLLNCVRNDCLTYNDFLNNAELYRRVERTKLTNIVKEHFKIFNYIYYRNYSDLEVLEHIKENFKTLEEVPIETIRVANKRKIYDELKECFACRCSSDK